MSQVFLHVYDVTNSPSVKTNNVIVSINKLMRDGIGLGGIFHGAVQVYDAEWSFGFCENGSGVFSCPPKQNPMYTYRETVFLGYTTLSEIRVNQILTDFSREWPGYSYDLLAKNCNHFCEQFCEKLGVEKLPGWMNRFANAGDIAVEVAGSAIERFKQAKANIVSTGKVAANLISGAVSSTTAIVNQQTENGAAMASFFSRFSLMKIPWRDTSQGSSSSQETPLRSSLVEEKTSDDKDTRGGM